MILDVVISIDGVPIRLTFERWYEHILEEHSYMSGYFEDVLKAIENPTFILRGKRGSKVAVVNIGRRQWLHVFYREISREDGFIISASIHRDYERSKIIWKLDS